MQTLYTVNWKVFMLKIFNDKDFVLNFFRRNNLAIIACSKYLNICCRIIIFRELIFVAT